MSIFSRMHRLQDVYWSISMFKILALFWACASCFGFSSIEDLSLEERVGQLFMVHFHGEIANEEARTLIQDTKVGGFIYYKFSNGLVSPEQVRGLSQSLQTLAETNPHPIPLLLAADQEGGLVAQLSHGFTQFPGNRALGETGRPELAKLSAFIMGQELRAVGVNMNLAPVVDINSNSRNPIIGVRSFGEDAKTVIAFGESALEGYADARVIATLKHFPGHGDVEADSHEDLPALFKTREELEEFELRPFKELSTKADAIMTAHMLVPALDPENCSTLSKKTISYLRETVGFRGVIMTDSLVMAGVLKQCQSVDEAAIRALEAGCDLLLLGGKLFSGERADFELTPADVRRVHGAIVHAVQTGRISEQRVNQAVEKILDLKKRYAASEPEKTEVVFNAASHRQAMQKIASLALKTVEKGPKISFPEKKIAVFGSKLLSGAIEETSLLKIGKETKVCFFEGLAPSHEDIAAATEAAIHADVLLICSYNAWKNPSQVQLIQSLIDAGKPAILLSLRDPLDASLFRGAHQIFSTFSHSIASIQAVCDELIKE